MTKWKEGGLLVIDHRNSPGITEEEMKAAGLNHPGFKAEVFLKFQRKLARIAKERS